jgi:hypothetical protein
MNLEEMKKKLKTYTEEQIILREHTLIRCFQREITRGLIFTNLLNPEKLIDVIEEEPRYKEEKKFKLIFELSRNKSFIIIISSNKKLNIITSVIRYRKWVRPIDLREGR